MEKVYKIIYKKDNGDVFERCRCTLPIQKIGEYTSMGWRILDIMLYHNNNWYSTTTAYADYRRAVRYEREQIKKWA